MSLSLKTSVVDHATPAIEAKLAKCSPSRLRAIIAPALVRHTQTHLLRNGKNKRGWPSTGFWADAARGTSWQSVDSGKNVSVVISINKIGVRQRFYGGLIRPVNKKALAIPISPVSYGHLPSDFPGLFLLPTKKGAYLVQNDSAAAGKETKTSYRDRRGAMGGNAKRRQRAQLNFLFKLVGSVNQPADPSVIPSTEELMEVAMTRIEEAVK
jgi:hypothetical protein